jgi:hypothetical protein
MHLNWAVGVFLLLLCYVLLKIQSFLASYAAQHIGRLRVAQLYFAIIASLLGSGWLRSVFRGNGQSFYDNGRCSFIVVILLY